MQIVGGSDQKGTKYSSNSDSDPEDPSRSEEREQTQQQREHNKVFGKRTFEFAHQNTEH